ncbi:PilZ domain-containing protein [Tsuneonella sp. YG55]|uniref:PilZ domain-containing protein n=1 Tax=Tsuneonella litorea TaxID=2976475 RepID=A0A9X2W1M6_9SPHN|nr:PilZ domain-containing protein [Tsuneonella litorea]MCT2558609.1 PilZ domain-containing protein [Tsuneonella litorea]
MTTDTEPADVEQREDIRAPLEVAISVRERGGHKMPATMLDLSCAGCRIKGAPLTRGTEDIWVRIPGLESLPARICWAEEGANGLEFERKLHPAVFQRMIAILGSGKPPGPVAAFDQDDAPSPHRTDRESAAPPPPRPSASRREQIRAGYVIPDPGMLLEKKPVEGGKSIFTLVRRNTARTSDHRHEPRFPAPPEIDLAIGFASMSPHIANVSASGLMLATETSCEIGDPVEVRFANFPPIEGTIVWKRADSFGVALPPESIDLTEAA